MKYDYYGNNNNNKEDLYSFTIQDIHKKQKEKENNRLTIYKNITSKCFKKIKESSLNEETFCFFQIPEYIPGLPIYNMTECIIFILNMLKDKGFNARYCDNFIIFISWSLPKPNLKLIEAPKQIIEKKNIISDLNLKYKPIENYRSINNFFPKKQF
jgi:hypothetical protein